ncbi:ubiquitin hydrolase [Trypanosoma grayi]|uniref:ubiquitin hydrolase n=1 Tax=Trypanosoma grayi TaxID=71804 RepID=UPI0004F42EA2|nr:ubiquitin hydrolase [Trypanosoma grayi]KEG08737.1 ubiquitin hydrolase [Trypanosoma grayi]
MLETDVWLTNFSRPPTGEGITRAPAPLPDGVLRAAYRLHMPCLCRHTTVQNRAVNCVAAPRCFAGMQTLSTDAAALKECVADIIGESPFLLPEDNNSCSSSSIDNTAEDIPVRATKATIPRRGIRNLGNTCYLNAVLQLLFSIPHVRHEVLRACAGDDFHTVEPGVCDLTGDATQRTQPQGHTEEEGLLASGLGELLAEMAFTRDGKGANAQSFASFLSLDTRTQQDAQEFFALLLGWLHDKGCEAVERVFKGTLLYDRSCGSCGRPFKRAEPFFFLSLPVNSSVEEALSTFLRHEEVEGFMCEGCSATTTVLSRQYIRTLPDILVVHLNRFTFDMQTLQRQKLTETVSFPLEWDLTDQMKQWQQRDEANTSTNPLSTSDEARYTLIGVVNHFGETALCGHYTFYGRTDEKGGWCHFDDAEVTKLQHRFQGTRGSSKDAYMLVYQRRVLQAANATGEVHVDPNCMTAAMGSDAPDQIVLPPRLIRHVERINREMVSARQTWETRRAEVASFLQQWADVTRELFDGSTGNSTGSANDNGEDGDVCVSVDPDDYVALPSEWLQQLGRCFFPSFVDVGRYGDGDKRKKRLRGGGGGGGGGDAVQNESATPCVRQGCETPTIAESMVNATERAVNDVLGGAGTTSVADCVLVEDASQAALGDHITSLCCPHGKLTPWGQYKLVPSAAVAKLASLLGKTPVLPISFTAASGDDTSLMRWRVRDSTCDLCTVAMAEEVLKLKDSWNEERAALAMLRDIREEGKSNTSASNNSNTGGEVGVYVSEDIIEYWEELLAVQAKGKDVVSRQGFTGFYTVLRQKRQGVCCDETQSVPYFNAPEKLLCEHHNLAPSAVVRVVPEALWRYLRERVVQPLCSNSDSTPTTQLDELIPYLPVDTVTKCFDCIQITVNTTAERHYIKMAKLDEAKRFPTVTALCQLFSVTQAEMRAQHPNRSVWKRNLERLCREQRVSWEKEQAAAIAAIEAQIATLRTEAEQKSREKAAWDSRIVRGRGNRKGNRVNSSSSAANATQSVPPSSPLLSSPSPELSAASTTNPSRLQLACEALSTARAATCPELYNAYGCVPTWWVMQWRRWYADVDGTVTPPPRFDHDDFHCPHGGALLAPHLLNPADPLWETKSLATHLARVWRRRDAVPSTAAASTTVNAADSVEEDDLPGIPPLLLVPMKEFVDILEAYGSPDMLLPRGEGAGENVVRGVNAAKTVLFAERNTERVFDPPSCDACVAALLESVQESSQCFVDGSLRLQLHLRRSRKHFYDASDVLRCVHHTTTLQELKMAISQRVLEGHGYVLPLEEMEILRGRKPLRRYRACPNSKEVVAVSSPITGEAPLVIDVDAESTPPSSQTNDNECTLFECGLCDGDVLTVNATERALTKFAGNAEGGEVWEEIPAALLQAAPENATAFGATRLYGAVANAREGGSGGAAPQLACVACTFINEPGRTVCEMCETPLPTAA